MIEGEPNFGLNYTLLPYFDITVVVVFESIYLFGKIFK